MCGHTNKRRRFFARRTLSELLCLGLVAACFDVSGTERESGLLVIDQFTVDGRSETSSPGKTNTGISGRLVAPGPHRLSFRFGPPDEMGPPLRLRYRLEHLEAEWQEAGGEMLLSLMILNSAGEVVALHRSPMRGESPGWTNSAATSQFSQRRERIQLPSGAESILVVFSSGMWDTRAGASHPTVGLAMVDECRMWITNKTGAARNIWPNSSFEEGAGLDKPTGRPRGWQRGEFGASMAKVLTLPQPERQNVLALEDDNPRSGAEWRCELSLRGLLQGETGLTVEWEELFTVGAAGEQVVEYPYVPPGNYVFRVQALTPLGNATGDETTLVFSIPQVFWKRPQFVTLGALVVLAAVAAVAREFTRRRMGRDLARLELQRGLERERARIAQDMHDDLGSGLTRMAFLSRSARRAVDPQSPAAGDLDDIHQTSQDLTRALDEIVWAVDPAHDSLEGIANYLGRFAQDFLSTAGMECRLDLPVQLPGTHISADTRHNLFLAFKEVLNNVVRHSGAREVDISLGVGPNEFTLCVKDDGKGFDPASASAPTSGSGRGTPNLHSRMARVGGVAEIDSSTGKGTCVRLRVPLAPGAGSDG